jgi:carbamoyl-phosphate synthase small subunit
VGTEGHEQTLNPAYVLLEDGAWFAGTARHPFSMTTGEIVFTTNLTGYQEVFTDPSYLGQLVVMTATMIGNYGVNLEDVESASGKPQVSGVLVRELARTHSNWRASAGLDEWLADCQIPIIEDLDTRKITRHIRSQGAMRAILANGPEPDSAARDVLAASPRMEGRDLASIATTKIERTVGEANAKYHLVAYDFGIKESILRLFQQMDCRVTVVPAQTPAARVRELDPDGLFLSNGPGDPAAVSYVLDPIRELAGSGLPTFGICLGHQLLALAFGAETEKLPYGHRGGNHPVKDLHCRRVLITSQNHGFAVRGTSNGVSGAKELEVTHLNLNDHTVEGLKHRELPVVGVQYHPEASPGPHDARSHFGKFLQTLDSKQVSS